MRPLFAPSSTRSASPRREGAERDPSAKKGETPELAAARRCAEASGVTRLAELTRLDGLDVPVFQAVRPWSRALSVHQGKGETPERARLGALMEAVESHAAERFAGARVSASAADLKSGAWAADARDFGVRPGALEATATLEWTPARTLLGGREAWTPWWAVSLDLTVEGDARLERSSNGLAAGLHLGRARRAALCELLERDAVAEWLAEPATVRAQRQLLVPEVEESWLQAFMRRARSQGVYLTVYGLRSLVGWPVAVAVLDEPAARPLARASVFGSACRATGAEALQAAVLEAAQSRLTAISAVRDDILPGPRSSYPGLGLAPPLPSETPGTAMADWATEGDGCWATAAAKLERLGHGPVVEVELSAPMPARVVKLFAPGLAMGSRRRRPRGAAR